MRQESITNMIDKKIITSLVEGHAIRSIQDDLNTRMNNMVVSIKTCDRNVDVLYLLTSDVNKIQSTRQRYQVMYIKECGKRVKDLEWLINNKYKFPRLSNSQVFNLLKLKEKLSEENALPF